MSLNIGGIVSGQINRNAQSAIDTRSRLEPKRSEKKFPLYYPRAYVERPGLLELNITDLKKYMEDKKRRGLPIEGQIGDFRFLVNPKKPSEITFEYLDGSIVVIDEGKVVYSEILVDFGQLTYVLGEDSIVSGIPQNDHIAFEKKVYVIGFSEINEYYKLNYFEKIPISSECRFRLNNKLLSDILESLKEENPEFSEGTKLGELYRQEINPEENIEHLSLSSKNAQKKVQGHRIKDNDAFSRKGNYREYFSSTKIKEYIRRSSVAYALIHSANELHKSPNSQKAILIRFFEILKEQEREIISLEKDQEGIGEVNE